MTSWASVHGGPPSGVVTFLFTDIEGSTRPWEADAGAMRAALLVHDEVLRDAIEAHEGFLFSHTGDGVVAAFASPMSAVDAAVKAQLALELPVRMGIATGEAELRDDDYFGTVLNRAARVMAAGHGGQILVAESTASLLSGVDLIDLGPRRLRDVPMPVGVFQVRAPGLREEFPPPRALDMTPGNLRPADHQLDRARDGDRRDPRYGQDLPLGDPDRRWRSWQTRLALEVAARLADEFPDGVWLFELAAVNDPAAVPDAVAAVLGITQQAGKTVSESVATALEGRVRLLVIDNCEHVLDAAADLIEAILAHSATVRIVATSREGLGVPDEQVRPVRTLDAAAGIDSAAVTLFIERAQGIASGFSMVDGDEAAAVTEICQRLDGIPLAIELAASRMASMTASEMRDRLDHRFRLLVGSRRGLERHHTLRHAVAWSYDLLDDTEKTVLDRCSVFAGGFDLQSACAVAGSDDLDEYAILEVLDALVRKSLLVADRSSGGPGFQCWRPSASSARSNSSGEVMLTQFGRLTRGISRTKNANVWRCGTALTSGRLTGGSALNSRICASRFVGPQTCRPRRCRDNRHLHGFSRLLCRKLRACLLGGRVGRDRPRRQSPTARVSLHNGDALLVRGTYRGGRRVQRRRTHGDGHRLGEVPFGLEGTLPSPYLAIGQPDRAVERCRALLARAPRRTQTP